MKADRDGIGERTGRRPGIPAALAPPAPWWLVLLASLAWLVLAAIVGRFTTVTDAAMLLGAALLLGASDEILAAAGCGLPPRRKLSGHALAVALALFLTLLLAGLHGRLSLTADVAGFLIAVIVVALAGGFIPAVLEAVTGALLLHWFVPMQGASFAAGETTTAAGLGVLVAAAMVVGFWVEDAARRGQRAIRMAQADRARTALLATVSHDLRTPLAAAKAAVSCLRLHGLGLTTDDHDELLAAADESLDQLTDLATSLLDVSRLQAGVLAVFPCPADLGQILTSALRFLGPQAQAAVLVKIPCEIPEVIVDPAIMERVIVNLVGNALRYSPTGSPTLLTASSLADRVMLRVVDHGPGLPETDRNRAFLPFQRLGDTSKTVGVGLGLVVSRGLVQAMGGTVEPEETPGGGLTMAVSLPAAPAQRRAEVGSAHRYLPPQVGQRAGKRAWKSAVTTLVADRRPRPGQPAP
jgi:two-component system, OmpR family, sensor histidine kinase KdpD